MGAINKLTNNYEYPKIALKTNKYSCPDCKRDVILKKGNIRIHHFSHYKSDNPCMYYDRPGESQIHKDAKLAFKTILEQENEINFFRKCISCKNNDTHIIDKKEKNTVNIEYPFIFNDSNKKADIAYIEEDSIKYIFEICYKNKTCPNNRPEPWFEINAEKLLHDINTIEYSNNLIEINCIRSEKCNTCKIKEIEQKEKEKEKQRLKEIEEQKYKDYLDIKNNIRSEIRKKVWAEHKKCSKCKSFDRCKKCVDKLYKKYNVILEFRLKQTKI